ncbi:MULTISPECIES: TrlF family AAA-like ATPase [unclassified Pseudoalteromonas]|uniref:TrlF family AAA-like ATPase n=1 Tax=unclassified Pseudoalteromonas TaxID=194690 RepID=UPI0015FFA4C5|nr:DNA repair protein [Pseudoalteromonas sp. SR44-8]MBB1299710.1 DNA repair protein [Pseudoalteromonas sp. SR44-8]
MIGSIWGKWDLHIHSPYTHQANEYGASTIDEFVDKIISSKLSLTGITNYFFFKDNELGEIREKFQEKGVEHTVLGNLEFRIDQQNKDGEWINVHCIFSENISTQQINSILSTLPISNTTSDGKHIYCSQQSFTESQTKTSEAFVKFDSLIAHLNNNLKFGVDFLIAACPNGYGGFRPDMKEGRSLAVALEIEKRCQIILGRPQDRNFFLKEDRYPSAKQKPVFHASDAHKLEDIGTMYSWVKAKPTFEGLRQSIIEPDLRVQQTDDFVENTYIKPWFKSVELGGKVFAGEDINFFSQTIPLNPNLVTIVGGRGTGKSLFLDAMHSRFNHQSEHSNARRVSGESLCVELDQGDGTVLKFDSSANTYSYLHVSQGDVQHFSQKPDDLSGEIKRMLGIHGVEFDSVTSSEISNNLSKYRTFVEYWEDVDSQNQRVNTQQYQQSVIDNNTQLIGTLTNPQNKLLIEQYQKNSKNINEKNNFIDEARSTLALLNRHAIEINQKITLLNTNLCSTNQAPLIDDSLIKYPISKNIDICNKEIEALTESNSEIASQFRQQGINQDISSLLSKVTEYQKSIDLASSKLDEINQKTMDYQAFVKERGELALKYKEYIDYQKDNIDQAFQNLKIKQPNWNDEQNELVQEILSDIHINGRVVFNVNHFYSGIEECLNRGKFRSTSEKSTFERLKETFCVRSIDDFFKLLSGEKIINCDGAPTSIEEFFWKPEFFNKGGRFELLNYLYSPSNIRRYLYANADFQYKGKTVNKLSVGQRGTFYVCLKLATDPFGSPFVFDQPEDDLDNEFIMSQLVPLFRKIKKYRQVIIVTHNANLVVNTDAEQIIIADNQGESIRYTSGSVEDGNVKENIGIRAEICNILEGGSYAFEKRERKYGIQELA